MQAGGAWDVALDAAGGQVVSGADEGVEADEPLSRTTDGGDKAALRTECSGSSSSTFASICRGRYGRRQRGGWPGLRGWWARRSPGRRLARWFYEERVEMPAAHVAEQGVN